MKQTVVIGKLSGRSEVNILLAEDFDDWDSLPDLSNYERLRQFSILENYTDSMLEYLAKWNRINKIVGL